MNNDIVAKRDTNRCPSHPGAVLDDIIQDVGKSKTEIAKALGISRQHLYDLLEEKKPLSPPMAARVAKAFGGSIGLWLRIQAAYDAWHAEREVDVSSISRLQVA
ncbi:HigA family addiction module antitoxin [Bosea sp. 685]|uniref:HigA family addiction module antitoxin n=1 Tax=Bosea sp. 685 TaxID=3080057 RepID=UPI0028931D95|nr:HigA family addiction module antitoxin [Bosea sp. 685]WNJ91110.1 HigA family addiction module antitoxin [Bosea sp. 685]